MIRDATRRNNVSLRRRRTPPTTSAPASMPASSFGISSGGFCRSRVQRDDDVAARLGEPRRARPRAGRSCGSAARRRSRGSRAAAAVDASAPSRRGCRRRRARSRTRMAAAAPWRGSGAQLRQVRLLVVDRDHERHAVRLHRRASRTTSRIAPTTRSTSPTVMSGNSGSEQTRVRVPFRIRQRRARRVDARDSSLCVCAARKCRPVPMPRAFSALMNSSRSSPARCGIHAHDDRGATNAVGCTRATRAAARLPRPRAAPR